MKNVVVATDFSKRGALAVARGAAIADGAGAQLTIVHAIGEELPPKILQARTREAERLLAGIAKSTKAPRARPLVVRGDIYWALHVAATKANAELIVAGDHRRNVLRDAFRDTTIERLVRVSAVPVLIARRPVAPSYRHALVGVESDEGPELVSILNSFGGAAPAKITVLHAFQAPAVGLMHQAAIDSAAIDRHRSQVARQARARLVASLSEHRTRARARVVQGDPAQALKEFAERNKCDLIAASTHARRSLARLLIGSVSAELLRHGSTDLLLAPRLSSASSALSGL